MNTVGNAFHTVGELLFIGAEPVSDLRLITVVNLEAVNFRINLRNTVQITHNVLLSNAAIIIVPGCIAVSSFVFKALNTEQSEIFVKHLVISAA